MTRAATTLADPCTGARRRDFLLGLRHGQLVRAQVPSWCSRHGWTLVAPDELARLASLQLVATRHLEGTGDTPFAVVQGTGKQHRPERFAVLPILEDLDRIVAPLVDGGLVLPDCIRVGLLAV